VGTKPKIPTDENRAKNIFRQIRALERDKLGPKAMASGWQAMLKILKKGTNRDKKRGRISGKTKRGRWRY